MILIIRNIIGNFKNRITMLILKCSLILAQDYICSIAFLFFYINRFFIEIALLI